MGLILQGRPTRRKKHYIDDKKEGEWVHYHANGQLRSKEFWTEGKYLGTYVAFFDNGQIAISGKIINGKKEGHWLIYHPDGSPNIEESAFFVDGVKQ